ncbi:MAG TPA: hypothetical protein VGE72_30710 [Azospirillum sp.]
MPRRTSIIPCAVLAALLPVPGPAVAGLDEVPDLVLWAWERPEDLRFIDPASTAVAVLTGTLFLDGDDVRWRPRLQPLRLPEGTRRIAVVHVHLGRTRPAADGAQRSAVLDRLAAEAGRPGIAALQVDFEAPPSLRPFYSAVLHELRPRLPAGLPVSITALASWCLTERWTAELPVDEVVPMLFRMGPAGIAIRARLADGGDLTRVECRGSVGVALDEPFPPLRPGRRVYAFTPRPWTEAAYRATLKALP